MLGCALACGGFAIAAVDFYLYSIYGPEATVSGRILNTARENPIITLGLGMLLGHLFWPQRP